MNTRQQKTLERFGQVLTFLDANTSAIAAALVASQRQVLITAISQINGFAQDQVLKGNETLLAQTLSSARIALRDTYMRQISTVGLHSLVGKQPTDPNVPNAKQIFTLPATRTNASALVQSAQAMVAAATPYASIFTAAGVSLDQSNAAILALQNAIAADANAKRIAKGATQGIAAQVQAGHNAVRLMDVVIRPQLATNKALLAQWESVKKAAGGVNLATPVPVPAAVASAGSSTSANASGTPTGATTSGSSATTPSTTSTTSTTTQPAAAPTSAPTAAAA